ncbi:MAG TPA: sigma-70 family RNA polymerase sigma factor [Arachidicoccus sp.]|nr:sigma-70 family RNA polymerase sigma factor [Arachidicoccus sp.]
MKDWQKYSDAALLDYIALDDAGAFQEVFRRYWEKLYGVAYNRLKSSQAAEDVVQEVLSLLWIRRKESAIQHLGKYLTTAVKYCVFYEIRKIQQRSAQEQNYAQMGAGALVRQLTPADELLFKAFVQELELEKGKLPEKCRLVFHYSRELGLSNKEIAEKLKLSPKTVEAHISRAIRQLRTTFKGPGAFIFF